MATKRDPVGVRAIGDGVEVRFKLDGKTLRPRLRIKPTKANLLHAERIREDVLEAIRKGVFKMGNFFPDYRLAEAPEQAGASERTFAEWVTVWEKFAAREHESSTLKIYKRHMKAYWASVWGALLPRQISHEMILTRLSDLATKTPERKPLGRKTQNNIMIPLRAVFDLISRAPGAPPNPTDGILNMKVQTGNPDPFTMEELDIALAQVLKKHGPDWHDYFEFAAFAGLRVSEQIALLWTDVDLRTGTIVVRRAKVLTDEKERTKTNSARTVELNDRALEVIKRQRARTQAVGKEVFWNPDTARPWNDEQVQHRNWAIALRAAGIRHRPPKELRDTSVTLALVAGCDPYWVAGQHGHSVTTMMKDYAKWIPTADRGRNRDALNRALGQPQAKAASNDE